MRILILAGWYPNQNNPMKGIFIREQASALQKAGVKVSVYYPYDEEIAPGKMVKHLEQKLEVYRANTLGKHNRYLARITGHFLGLKDLRQITAAFQPDLIHAHVAYPAGILAWLYHRRTGLPYVITEHMSYLKDYVDKFQHRILLKVAFENARYVLPVSNALAEQIWHFGWKTNLHPVPNVVDTERFTDLMPEGVARVGGSLTEKIQPASASAASPKAAPAPDRPPAQSLNLLFVGSLEDTEIKGLDQLLPAFAELLRLELNPLRSIHLHIVGGGSKRQDYEQTAHELKIAAHCTFYGQIPPAEMAEFYRSADLLVSASRKETFGCTLIEAMACGKPVLATRCGGPQEIVRPEVGILVEPGSREELLRGLQASLQALPHYDSKAIRRYAEEHYSPKAVATKLIDIYSAVLR